VVLECIEFDVQSTITSCDRIRVVPLLRNVKKCTDFWSSERGTYLQIHRDAVPEVHSEPERIVARVECATFVVELVTECQCLRFAVDILACLDVFGCIGIN
jgi:hypothetical protein